MKDAQIGDSLPPCDVSPTPHRILGISSGEPFDARTWSGTSLSLFAELRLLGYVNCAFSAGAARAEKLAAQALSFSPSPERWRARFQSSPWPSRLSTAKARRGVSKIDRSSFDAILQLGPYLERTDKPIVSFHDDELSAALGLNRVTIADSRARLRFEGRILRSMDRIFTMSDWAADALSSYHAIPRDRVESVGAGSNIDEALLEGERDFSQLHLLFVGRDFERKGGREVLSAFATLRKHLPKARLTLVGIEPAGAVADGVESLGLIRLVGESGKRRMAEIYRSASLFLMPSSYEPFGIAFVEAMAAGLPCIGTNRCAMPEIIGDGGIVVPPGDVAALSRAMYDILSDSGTAAEFGARARRRYFERYGWKRVARRIGEAVDSLCGTS